MIIEEDAMHNHNVPGIALHGALGLFFVFSRWLAHGVMMWSGLRTPGYVETPGNMALLCLCLQALGQKSMRALTHGAVTCSGLSPPGNLEIPGNTALLCWLVLVANLLTILVQPLIADDNNQRYLYLF